MVSSLPKESQAELQLFQNEINAANPSDFLQFSANYFNKRLEQQRAFLKAREPEFKAKNIVLFPEPEESFSRPQSAQSQSRSRSSVMFKSPFVNEDPHSNVFKSGFNLDPHEQDTHQQAQEEQQHTREKTSTPPLPMHFNAQRRTSVSGETLQPNNFDDWTPDHYKEKSEQQLQRLEKSIRNNFLFNKLDSDSKRLVINCLEEKSVLKGATIIKQGDQGDYFYVVEKGTVDFYVNDNKVNSSGPGSSFGELALMYNSPRAATVVATSDCLLWALDRLTFRKILLGSSFKKRLMYDDLLKSMPVLKSLTTYDRAKLADALDTKIYQPGETIIREGDQGENFYLIEYGAVDVSKKGQGVINKLKDHDYFGEVALLNDLPRQATVTATKRTKVATLGKSGFQRLLGPAVDVLKLNDPTRH